jgi:hypothetical protein
MSEASHIRSVTPAADHYLAISDADAEAERQRNENLPPRPLIVNSRSWLANKTDYEQEVGLGPLIHRNRCISSGEAVAISNKRYRGGLASYYEVLEAQHCQGRPPTLFSCIRTYWPILRVRAQTGFELGTFG